jgi:acetyl esterase/lipase
MAEPTTHAYHPAFAAAVAPMAEVLRITKPLPAGDVKGRRDQMAGMMAMAFPVGEAEAGEKLPHGIVETVHRVEAEDGHSVNLHQFAPAAANAASISANSGSPAVLYIHGGGLILGSVVSMKAPVVESVAATGITHFAVEYRLAPEHPYPTPLRDCYAALEWMHSHARELGIDAARVAVKGESAGGGLAAGLVLLARDRKLDPPIKRQILIYPMLDDRTTTPSSALATLDPPTIWNATDNATGWGAYLGPSAGAERGVDVYAAPARAVDLRGLPPTYMDVGTLDLFRDEDVEYAARLVKAGVPVEFHLLMGLPHGWELFQPQSQEVEHVLQARLRFLGGL